MSEDKQLTVAELLARSSASGTGSSGTPRRRRRRSLEEGGISVAELTGSLPKVKDKPAESRHSSIPIDAPEGTGEKDQNQQKHSEKAASEEIPEKRAPESHGFFTTAPEKKVDEHKSAEGIEKKAPEQAEAKKAKESERKDSPSAHETAVIQKVTEDEPTTKVEEDAAAESEEADSAPTFSAQREASEAEDLGRQDGAEGEAKQAVDTEAANGEIAEGAAAAEVEKETGAHEASEKTAESSEEKQKAEERRVEKPKKPRPKQKSSSGWGGAILLAIVGIVLGAIVFLGFSMLWGSGLSSILVAVLALIITAVMIGVAHVLRTERDGLSMVLAGIVGLFMTFGPVIPALLS